MRAELERPIFDGAFWSSILHSRTFWVPQDHGALLGTFAIAMLLLASMLLLPRLSARRRRISELHGDISGSTTMMDFVLVTPVFVFFMFVVFQFTILAKTTFSPIMPPMRRPAAPASISARPCRSRCEA